MLLQVNVFGTTLLVPTVHYYWSDCFYMFNEASCITYTVIKSAHIFNLNFLLNNIR